SREGAKRQPADPEATAEAGTERQPREVGGQHHARGGGGAPEGEREVADPEHLERERGGAGDEEEDGKHGRPAKPESSGSANQPCHACDIVSDFGGDAESREVTKCAECRRATRRRVSPSTPECPGGRVQNEYSPASMLAPGEHQRGLAAEARRDADGVGE